MIMAAGCVLEVAVTDVRRCLSQIVGPLPLGELYPAEIVSIRCCLDLLIDAKGSHQGL
jgi:hypothetical protein